MTGIGTGPEETGGPLEAASQAVTDAEAVVWGERATNADAFEAAIARLVRAVEKRCAARIRAHADRDDIDYYSPQGLGEAAELIDPDAESPR